MLSAYHTQIINQHIPILDRKRQQSEKITFSFFPALCILAPGDASLPSFLRALFHIPPERLFHAPNNNNNSQSRPRGKTGSPAVAQKQQPRRWSLEVYMCARSTRQQEQKGNRTRHRRMYIQRRNFCTG